MKIELSYQFNVVAKQSELEVGFCYFPFIDLFLAIAH